MKIIYKDGTVAECPQEEELHVLRHTAAHIMAQAIKRLYPQADFAFGPATENGFFYDVDLGDTKLTDDDLAAIEKEMKKICKENLPIKPFILPRDEAVKLMEERQEHYKIEHIADLADETEFSFYQQGEYVDMCIGPHLCYTKALKAFKITQQSGAYWKNDKENKMLTRINGVAFHNQEELDAWEKQQQEARERDHRKIGKEMRLFMTDDLVGRGLPMFLPNGYTVWQQLEDYIKGKERERGYLHVMTPCIGTVNLYKTSGHWDHYRENMFPAMEMEGESYVLRPMNCPHHMMIYANQPHSYRQLPIRIGEIAHDFRYESSGTLKGIERGRHFCQNDAHLFCTPEQIKSEVANVCALIFDVYKDFNITDYRCVLSLRDPADKKKYHDDDAMWNHAENALREVLTELGIHFTEEIGEAGCQRQARRRCRVHAVHLPAGLLPACEVPPDLHRQGRQREDPRRAASRDPRLSGPLHGLPDRGDEGPFPDLAGPDAGQGAARQRKDAGLCEGRHRQAAGRRCPRCAGRVQREDRLQDSSGTAGRPRAVYAGLGREGSRSQQYQRSRPQGRDDYDGLGCFRRQGCGRDHEPRE
jgi:threonyl-tRNA synthetase